jgi:Lysylphosphatidylglycerol synthase TM region
LNIKVNDNPQRWMKRIRWFTAIFALVYLYYELFIHHNSSEIVQYAIDIFATNPWPLIAVFLLMPINWLLETIKWRFLLRHIYHLGIAQAIKGVLMGVSVGLFTPNGIGEFAGRMLVVPGKYRESSISASIAGSMAQLAITITIGGACVVFFAGSVLTPNYTVAVSILSAITIVLGFILYFRMPRIASFLLNRWAWFRKHQQFVDTFQNFNKRSLTKAYFISLLRYLVFCSQIYILVRYTVSFDVAFSSLKLFFLMPVYFYIQTLIPTIALGEVGIRGAVLIYLLSSATSTLPILMATTLVWLINIVVPSMLGLIVSFTHKSQKTS